jgi:hypothetical protein
MKKKSKTSWGSIAGKLLTLLVCFMALGFLGCPQPTSDDDDDDGPDDPVVIPDPYPAQHGQSPRTIITTDPEGDDKNSLIHALLYANDMNIVGLVYSASQWHSRGNPDPTIGGAFRWSVKDEDWRTEGFGQVARANSDRQYWHIDRAVEAYAQVYNNLKVHDPDYPTPDYLRSIIKIGNIDYAGDITTDSEGAQHIAALLNGLYAQNTAETEGKIYIQIWGGMNTAARALKNIETAYSGTADWAQRKKTIIDNTVFLSYADQEGSTVPGNMGGTPNGNHWRGRSYTDYVNPTWRYTDDDGVVHGITWRDCQGMWGYGCSNAVQLSDSYLISPGMNKVYIKDVGPLGAMYWFSADYTFIGGILDLLRGESRGWVNGAVTAEDITRINGYIAALPDLDLTYASRSLGYTINMPTPNTAQWTYASEGDSTAFATLIDNGLRNWVDPTWGGWGGRQTIEDQSQFPGYWSNRQSRESTYLPASQPGRTAAQNSMARWFGWAWRDFLARMQWTVKSSYGGANHPPVVFIKEGIDLTAKAGDMVTLHMDASDPDGGSLSLTWWEYPEADTYGGIDQIDAVGAGVTGSGDTLTFMVPVDALPGETIHIIAQAKDSAPDPFTGMRWQRVVVTVVAP